MATPRHKSAEVGKVKPPKQFIAIVEQQLPAQSEVAILCVVGSVAGTREQCWQQAKRITPFPILTFKEVNHVMH